MTSVLSELIGFHKNFYPCPVIGDFPIIVYILSLLMSRLDNKGIDGRKIWKSIL